MKKILLVLTILFGLNNLSADEVTDNKINLVKQLVYKQDILAGAIDMYITLYGTVPANVTAIKSANLLGSNFTYSGTMSINGANKEITLTDTVDAPEVYQSDYYINTTDRNKFSTPSVTGTSFSAVYPFTQKALYSYSLASNGVTVQPTAPASVNGTYWLNSITKHLYYFQGSWISLNVKKLYIVRDTAELPTTHNNNDGAIVLTTTTLTKYISNGTNWYAIPQAIPFTYNGAF
jgi:hypothetical protein